MATLKYWTKHNLIKTIQNQVLEEEEINANAYNMTACCERVQLSSVCMPLCSYNAKMSDLRTLAPLCEQEFNKLVRCGAGGMYQVRLS